MSEKPQSFAKKLKSMLYNDIMEPAFKQGGLLNGKNIRKIFFKMDKNATFTIGRSEEETFVLVKSDQVSSKKLFISGEVLDFFKLKHVVDILGADFKLDLLIDVGGNIGTICIPAVNRGLAQKAITFEPEPKNFAALSANIYLNSLSERITAHNIALGPKNDEVVTFELSDHNGGDHRVSVSTEDGQYNEKDRKKISVKSETLEKMTGEINPDTTLIWMDTQGYEGHILSGAGKLLKLNTPIVLEFWPYGMKRANSYESLKSALVSNNYTHFYNLDAENTEAIELNEKTLNNLFVSFGDGNGFTDILVVSRKA